jgi:CRP-like cAMP-binding protein
MTQGTGTRLTLQPVVSWPRAMTAGRRHLVRVDLQLAAPAGTWPYHEEALAFTCMLDGSDWCSVEAAGDARVLVRRTGESAGPAEFVVTPRQAGDRSLWLTIVTPRGLPVRTAELAVQVSVMAGAPAPGTPGHPGEVRPQAAARPPDGPAGPAFWDALTAQEQRTLEGFAKIRTYRAGSVLCREGDRASRVFLLQSGWVKVSLEVAGSERIVALRGPGDVVGELIGRETNVRTATVTVLDLVQALVIPKDRFNAFLADNPGVARVLKRQDEERLAENAGLRRQSGAAGAERRLASHLLELARHQPPRGVSSPAAITISISELELANWLNARPGEVAGFLHSWRERGIVQTGRGRLSVIDLGALARIRQNRK